ncbi:MAG: TonB-dependent receptor plug domain-containing protein [Crocinitomicaceae bacterium]
MKTIILIVSCVLGLNALAQQGDGTIMGTVYGQDSTKVQPFAIVWIDYQGSKFQVRADVKGKYKISPVKAGTYNLHSEHLEGGVRTMTGINVYSDAIAKHNVYLADTSTMLAVTEVVAEPLIQLEHVKKISLADIKNNPNIQSPKTMLVGMNSDITLSSNDELIVRGSRPGDVIYYVDGVKQTDIQTVPGVAIKSMSVYTGGIPAKYGDTTGGIVILETKSYFDLYYAWKASQD